MYWPFSVPTSVRAHLPFLPLLSHSLSLSLAQSKQTKDGVGWGGGGGVSWNTEGSLSGIFSYGFLQACILNEHIMP